MTVKACFLLSLYVHQMLVGALPQVILTLEAAITRPLPVPLAGKRRGGLVTLKASTESGTISATQIFVSKMATGGHSSFQRC